MPAAFSLAAKVFDVAVVALIFSVFSLGLSAFGQHGRARASRDLGP